MEAKELYEKTAHRFSGKIGEFNGDVLEPYFYVEPSAVVEVCTYLRDSPEHRFEVLSDLTALDLPKQNWIQLVYHLYSYTHRHQAVLKVNLHRENPRVSTVENVWQAANWFEREVFDLFGVIFDGHSDLRRILLPEDWVGYPLRKDYVEQEEYDGISTERAPLVDKLLR